MPFKIDRSSRVVLMIIFGNIRNKFWKPSIDTIVIDYHMTIKYILGVFYFDKQIV